MSRNFRFRLVRVIQFVKVHFEFSPGPKGCAMQHGDCPTQHYPDIISEDEVAKWMYSDDFIST